MISRLVNASEKDGKNSREIVVALTLLSRVSLHAVFVKRDRGRSTGIDSSRLFCKQHKSRSLLLLKCNTDVKRNTDTN